MHMHVACPPVLVPPARDGLRHRGSNESGIHHIVPTDVHGVPLNRGVGSYNNQTSVELSTRAGVSCQDGDCYANSAEPVCNNVTILPVIPTLGCKNREVASETKGMTSMNLAEILRNFCGIGLLVLMTTASPPARAQTDAAGSYPNKAIHIIVGFAAGGGNDIFARVVGQKLQAIIGATVVIENKPGAGGRIASEYVASQPADGYTLLVGASGAMSIAAAIYPKLPYHPTRSFVPLSMIANFPLILVVPENHPVKSVKELVAWAKANPDKANYATTSPAFTITTELLKLKAGMPGVTIPYKSSNEMLLSVVGEQTLFTIVDGPPAVPMVKGGKVRALAVTGSRRSDELPNVPAMSEAGFPEV